MVVSTRQILQTLVSADNIDVYRPLYFAPCPPFNCAYSHGTSIQLLHDGTLTPLAGAKSGQDSLLAIVTEHGAVEICNASKRDTWDLGMFRSRYTQVYLTIPTEPSRVTFTPHDNAIYEARWRVDDEFIVRKVPPCV
jgi:hypothetical protein